MPCSSRLVSFYSIYYFFLISPTLPPLASPHHFHVFLEWLNILQGMMVVLFRLNYNLFALFVFTCREDFIWMRRKPRQSKERTGRPAAVVVSKGQAGARGINISTTTDLACPWPVFLCHAFFFLILGFSILVWIQNHFWTRLANV